MLANIVKIEAIQANTFVFWPNTVVSGANTIAFWEEKKLSYFLLIQS